MLALLAAPLAAARERGALRADRGATGAPPWSAPGTTTATQPDYSATLEQCVASGAIQERSVTFTGQMQAVSGTQRMGMRIVLQERAAGEEAFHDVKAPDLGVWRDSEAGVGIYRYVKQITHLSSPAAYRAVVHFRWWASRGRVLRHAVLRTARCIQPAAGTGAAPGPQPPAA